MSTRKRLSQSDRAKVYDMFNGRCAYCGCEITMKEMCVEHVNPLYLGGADDMANMVPACRMCNHYKATMPPEKFKQMLQDTMMKNLRNDYRFRMAIKFGLVSETGKSVKFLFEEAENGKLHHA